MKQFFPHRLNADGVDTNALHLMEGFFWRGEVKESNPFHRGCTPFPWTMNGGWGIREDG
jgi:hypothetical protein